LTPNDILTLLLRALLDRRTQTKEQEMGERAGPSKEKAMIRGDHVDPVLGELGSANRGHFHFAVGLTAFESISSTLRKG
jgi:hypothetical protein